MTRVLTMLLMAVVTLGGCASPEATRTRGGGPGGDVGNRRGGVRMHEGSDQFWRTPVVNPAGHPPLEPARQAQQLSRR
jgi:uncharacterized protein YceK